MADRTWHENRNLFIQRTDEHYEEYAEDPAMSDVLSNLSFYSSRTISTKWTASVEMTDVGTPVSTPSWGSDSPLFAHLVSDQQTTPSSPSGSRARVALGASGSWQPELDLDRFHPSHLLTVTGTRSLSPSSSEPERSNPTSERLASLASQNGLDRTTFRALLMSNSSHADTNEADSNVVLNETVVDGHIDIPTRSRTQWKNVTISPSRPDVSPISPRTISDITEDYRTPVRQHTQWRSQLVATSRLGVSPSAPQTISDITEADGEAQHLTRGTPSRPRTQWKRLSGAAALAGASPSTPRTVSNITRFTGNIGFTEKIGGTANVSVYSISSVALFQVPPETPNRTPTRRAGNWNDPDVLEYMSPQTSRRRGEARQPLVIEELQDHSDTDTIVPNTPTPRRRVCLSNTVHLSSCDDSSSSHHNGSNRTNREAATESDTRVEQDELLEPNENDNTDELEQDPGASIPEVSVQTGRSPASVYSQTKSASSQEHEISAADGETNASNDTGDEVAAVEDEDDDTDMDEDEDELRIVTDISEPDLSTLTVPLRPMERNQDTDQDQRTIAPSGFVPFQALQPGHLGLAYNGANSLGSYCTWETYNGWHHTHTCPHRCILESGLHLLRCGCEVYLDPQTPCSVRCLHNVRGTLRNGRAPACPCVPAGCYTQYLSWIEDTEIIEWAWRLVYHARPDLRADVACKQRDVFRSLPEDIRELLPPRAEWGDEVDTEPAVQELQRRHALFEAAAREQRENIALDEWEYSSIYPPETSNRQPPSGPARAGDDDDGDTVMSFSDDGRAENHGYDPVEVAAASESLQGLFEPLMTRQALRTAIPASTLALLESPEADKEFKESLRDFIMAEVHREIQIQGQRLLNDQILYRQTTQQVLNRCCREARAVLLARRNDSRDDMLTRKLYLWQRIDQLAKRSGGYFDHHWLNSKAIDGYNENVLDGKWYNLCQADLEDLLKDMDPEKQMLNCLIFKTARGWERDGVKAGKARGWHHKICGASREGSRPISGIGLVKQYEAWLGRPLKHWTIFLQRAVLCQVNFLVDPEHVEHGGLDLFLRYENIIWQRNQEISDGEANDDASLPPLSSSRVGSES